MRYLAIYRPESGVEGAAPSPEHMAQMRELTEASMADGSLISTGPLTPRAQGARVRLSGGQFTVSEETERAAGWAFLEAKSREEAIEFCRQFLKVAGDGVTELRQVMEFPPAM